MSEVRNVVWAAVLFTTVGAAPARAQKQVLTVPHSGGAFLSQGCWVGPDYRVIASDNKVPTPVTTPTPPKSDVNASKPASKPGFWRRVGFVFKPSSLNAPTAPPKPEAEKAKRTMDTMVVVVSDGDGTKKRSALADIDVFLDNRWAARIESGKDSALLIRSAGLLTGKSLRVEGANRQLICDMPSASAATAAADGPPKKSEKSDSAKSADGDTLSDPAITLHIGVERSSANGFGEDKTSPAIGVRWDFGSVSAGNFFINHSLTSDYTQVVKMSEYRSCHGTGGLPVEVATRLTVCGAPDSMQYYEFSDSLRAGIGSTWRTAFVSRVEFGAEEGLRLGGIVSLAFQTDPSGWGDTGFSNTEHHQFLLRNLGAGIRMIGAKGVERIRLDWLRGDVAQYNFRSERRNGVLSDSSPAYLLAPRQTVGSQHQVSLGARLFKGAYLRAYTTIKAPELPGSIPAGSTSVRRYRAPDLTRIGFLLTRDVKDVWDVLVGKKAAKDPGEKTENSGDKTDKGEKADKGESKNEKKEEAL